MGFQAYTRQQVLQGPWDIVPIGGCWTPSHYRRAALEYSGFDWLAVKQLN